MFRSYQYCRIGKAYVQYKLQIPTGGTFKCIPQATEYAALYWTTSGQRMYQPGTSTAVTPSMWGSLPYGRKIPLEGSFTYTPSLGIRMQAKKSIGDNVDAYPPNTSIQQIGRNYKGWFKTEELYQTSSSDNLPLMIGPIIQYPGFEFTGWVPTDTAPNLTFV